MKKRATEISIQFKQPPLLIFNRMADLRPLRGDSAQPAHHPHPARRRHRPALRRQGPHQLEMAVCPVNMDFDYEAAFGKSSANGYERLLLDAMLGDQTLFAHRDGVETNWALYTPILAGLGRQKAAGLSQLLRRLLGPRVRRPPARARRPHLAQRPRPQRVICSAALQSGCRAGLQARTMIEPSCVPNPTKPAPSALYTSDGQPSSFPTHLTWAPRACSPTWDLRLWPPQAPATLSLRESPTTASRATTCSSTLPRLLPPSIFPSAAISKTVTAIHRRTQRKPFCSPPRPDSSVDRLKIQPMAPAIPIYEIGAAAERIAAAAEAAHALSFPFTLTARAENYLHGRNDLADTIQRLQAYQQAGADVLYAPGLTRKEDIEAVVRSVDRPVNVLAGLGDAPLDFATLSALGVRRISVGGALSRAAIGGFLRAAHEMHDNGTFTFTKDAANGRDLNQIFATSAE